MRASHVILIVAALVGFVVALLLAGGCDDHSSTTSSHVGDSCHYVEAALVGACEHTGRCSWAGGATGGCQTPVGGIVCS